MNGGGGGGGGLCGGFFDTVYDLINTHFQINASYLINAPSTLCIRRLSVTNAPCLIDRIMRTTQKY